MATTIKSSAAVDKVLNTFELLEKVLIHVVTNVPHRGSDNRLEHLKALYRLQRVNSTFRDVIVRSKTIRVGTFRDQQESEKESGDSTSDAGLDQLYTSEKRELAINPSLRYFRMFLSGLGPCWFTGPRGMPSAGSVTFGVSTRGAVEQKRMSDSASWRGMLFAKLHLHTTLTLVVQHNVGVAFTLRRIELGGRVTLGEVADEIMKAVRDIEELHQRS